MNTNPSLISLSKDVVTNSDVILYLRTLIESYKLMILVKEKSIEGNPSEDKDIELIKNFIEELNIMIEKLETSVKLSTTESASLRKYLESVLSIAKYDTNHEFNSKGLELYFEKIEEL